MFEVQRRNQQNQSRAAFVDGRGRNPRWRWNVIPVNLRNPLLNTLSRYRYQVMNASNGGPDACTDDPAIQSLVVGAQHCRLENPPLLPPYTKENTRVTHLRLIRTRVLLVTVAGPIERLPSATFRHVYGTPDRRDPMMSLFQPVGGQKKVRETSVTYESASIDAI
jgi:hypothetical protein